MKRKTKTPSRLAGLEAAWEGNRAVNKSKERVEKMVSEGVAPEKLECLKCRKIKSSVEFFSNKRDGAKRFFLSNWCRECSSKRAKGYRDSSTKPRKKWKPTTPVPEYVEREYVRREFMRHKNDTVKRLAHSRLRYAVISGRLIRPKRCSKCQKTSNRIHGHHKDYTKPLDVEWLCHQCHTDEHSRIKKGTL